MKKWTLALLGATTAFALSSGAAMAAANVVLDAPAIDPNGTFTRVDGWFGNGNYNGGYNWVDEIGTDFETYSITFGFSGGNVIVKILTDYSIAGSSLAAFSDVAFDVDQDGNWETGLDINWTGTVGATGDQSTTAKLYNGLSSAPTGGSNPTSTGWLSSQNQFNTSGIYGGRWAVCDDSPNSCPADGQGNIAWTEVIESGGSLVQNVEVTQDDRSPPNQPDSTRYEISFVLTGVDVDLDSNGIGDWSDGINVFFGTGTCSNDAVYGSASVPVPAALPIIGAALAGFGFAGWRQRKAA